MNEVFSFIEKREEQAKPLLKTDISQLSQGCFITTGILFKHNYLRKLGAMLPM
jgi:hypothetical protein